METTVESPPIEGAPPKPHLGLAWQIVIGLAVGIAGGYALNHFPQIRDGVVTELLQPAGDMFIKLIRMIVVPIVFTSMVIGIAGVGDGKTLGRIGFKTLVYFEIITTIAIVLGLVIGNVLQPGTGTDMAQLAHTDISRYQQITQQVQGHHGFMTLVLSIVPDNILASMAKGDLLPVIFFSVLFGLALQSVPEEYRKPVVIAGFEPLDVMQAIRMLIRQVNEGRAEVENEFSRAVTRDGNRKAQHLVDEVFELRESFEWRGLGQLPNSALRIREAYADFDAERRFPTPYRSVPDHKACECGAILRGVKRPQDCKIFGTVCTPDNPVGSCMVSSEGACAAHYTYGRYKDV